MSHQSAALHVCIEAACGVSYSHKASFLQRSSKSAVNFLHRVDALCGEGVASVGLDDRSDRVRHLEVNIRPLFAPCQSKIRHSVY